MVELAGLRKRNSLDSSSYGNGGGSTKSLEDRVLSELLRQSTSSEGGEWKGGHCENGEF